MEKDIEPNEEPSEEQNEISITFLPCEGDEEGKCVHYTLCHKRILIETEFNEALKIQMRVAYKMSQMVPLLRTITAQNVSSITFDLICKEFKGAE